MTNQTRAKKTRIFYEEGVSVTVVDPSEEFFMIDGLLSLKKPNKNIRAIMKLELFGRENENTLLKQDNYEGQLIIRVRIKTGEEGWKLYIYDDAGDLKGEGYYEPTDAYPENDDRYPIVFSKYLTYEINGFPDPNMGIGP